MGRGFCHYARQTGTSNLRNMGGGGGEGERERERKRERERRL
jgi:hypothetical protein